MSYDVHEAYSLDSFQDSLLFWDDFEGDSLKDLWRIVNSVVVVDSEDGGIIRLTTGGTTNDFAYIDWNDIRSLHVDKKVTMELRVKLNHITYVDLSLQLRFDGSNLIRFRFNEVAGGAADWTIQCVDGGAGGAVGSGITGDTDPHIFRVECLPTGEVHFYIDGVETSNSPITTNIPDDAGDYLQPFIFIQTKEDVAKSLDVDYIYARQLR